MGYVEMTKHGPLWDGSAPKVVEEAATAMEADLAQAGADMVRQELHDVLKHPTSHYERSITTVQKGQSEVVTDGGVVYGPWLEGTGSRNTRTRFRGYATFRRVAQKLQEQAAELAQHTFDRFVGRLQ